jgi:hypothetical protein
MSLEETVEKYARGECALHVGQEIEDATVVSVSLFTVMFEDKQGWQQSIQVPWMDAWLNPNYIGKKLMKDSLKREANEMLEHFGITV